MFRPWSAVAFIDLTPLLMAPGVLLASLPGSITRLVHDLWMTRASTS